jgi:hypothetical protein
VLRHDLARLLEALRRRHRGGQRVDDPVVEADHRQVGLGDGEILVVAGSGITALRFLAAEFPEAARQVEAVPGGQAALGQGLPHLRVPVI